MGAVVVCESEHAAVRTMAAIAGIQRDMFCMNLLHVSDDIVEVTRRHANYGSYDTRTLVKQP
jgi:hypothetical protein